MQISHIVICNTLYGKILWLVMAVHSKSITYARLYIVQMHRIPHGQNGTNSDDRPAILMVMHCSLTISILSANYLVAGEPTSKL